MLFSLLTAQVTSILISATPILPSHTDTFNFARLPVPTAKFFAFCGPSAVLCLRSEMNGNLWPDFKKHLCDHCLFWKVQNQWLFRPFDTCSVRPVRTSLPPTDQPNTNPFPPLSSRSSCLHIADRRKRNRRGIHISALNPHHMIYMCSKQV